MAGNSARHIPARPAFTWVRRLVLISMKTVVTHSANLGSCTLLAAAITQPSFNDGFYTTAAAVIPVLYLALTVQGQLLPGLLTRLHKALETMRQARPGAPARPAKLVTAIIAAYATMTAAAIILTAGVAGEIIALLALANRHDSAAVRQAVMFSVIGLLIFTAAGPLWALNTAWVRLQWVPLRTAWHALRPARTATAPEPSVGEARTGPEKSPPETPPSAHGEHGPVPDSQAGTE